MPCLLVGPSRGTNAKEEEVGMATEMKSLIGNVLFIVTLCTGMRSAVADPETATVWSDCGNSGKYEYRNGSAFQLNLNNVLESLVRNVYPSGFNTSSIVAEGVNSNGTVYGLVQCRGDLDSSDCKQCASTAEAELVQGCHNTSGFIQLDGCFLRPKLFAADSVAAPGNLSQTIYSLAQCWRDLSQTSCGSCLTEALSDIFRCQSGAIGAQFGSKNCYLRYEVYGFFNTSVLSPPPGKSPPVSSGGKKSNVLGITLGVVAAIVGLIAAIGLWKWKHSSRRKCRERIYLVRGPELSKSFSLNDIQLMSCELFSYLFTPT